MILKAKVEPYPESVSGHGKINFL